MRTGGLNKSTVISLKGKLKELRIYSLALKCGFQKRKIKKIDALSLIMSFYNCHLTGGFSLSGWACQLGQFINKTISKQAVFDRLDGDFINLCRELLSKSLGSKLRCKKLLVRFNNVYIQDSSNCLLPQSLQRFYQGNGSRTGSNSLLKIQVIYNLVKNTFEELALSSFTRNDQAASPDILKYLRPNDLVIRDLGYFVINCLREIIKLKAHFICPLKKNISLFDQKTGQPLRLKKLLKNRKYLKQQVLLGKEQKLAVTLVAIKLDKSTARYKQKSALFDRDRRNKCTKEKLFLLEWDIFVCSSPDLTPQEIQAIYGIRWQIEIVFKSWKSHLNLEKNIPTRLQKPFIPEAIIYLTLLLSTIFVMPVYRLALKTISGVSLLKLTRFIASVMPQNKWALTYEQLQNHKNSIVYELRNRTNFLNKLGYLT